jgi:hypothetical protein
MAVNNKDFTKPAVQLYDQNSNIIGQWATGQTPQYVASGNATVAQVNAGYVIVPAQQGAAYQLAGVVLQAIGGSTATCTGVAVNDTASTPIVGVSVPAASLTQNTFVTETTANSTLTTFAWQGALTKGQGIQLIKVGSSACATVTSFNYKVGYQIAY